MPPVHEGFRIIPKPLKDLLLDQLGLEKARFINQGGAFWAIDGQIDSSPIIYDEVSAEIAEAAQDPQSHWHVVKPLVNSSHHDKQAGHRRDIGMPSGRCWNSRGGARRNPALRK